MAYQFMQANKNKYTVTEAGLFGVSRRTYYQCSKNGLSQRHNIADTELLCLIRDITIKHHRRYSSPRVRELRGVFSENILNREIHAEKGGMKWVSDITYLRTVNGWVYLTVIIDLYDRKVIGWSLSLDIEIKHTAVASLKMTVKNREPQKGLIFLSDRGVQYCAQAFRIVLREICLFVSQSISRKGNCWDNACVESFFKTLKSEMETLDGKHTVAKVRKSVFFYVEAYYNCIRIHLALDYVTPNMYNENVA